MATLDQFVLSSTVSFELYPSAVLGAAFTNVKVEDIVSASTARLLGVDVDSLHRNVYATLPAGTPDSPDSYPFVRFRQSNGQILTFGLPWIKSESVRSASYNTTVVTLYETGPDDYTRIVDALSANGFNKFKVETKNT